jgi:preprotein translocase subunit SecG
VNELDIVSTAAASMATQEAQQAIFTEAQFLRETLSAATWGLGTLFVIVTGLVVWIYLTRENNASAERRDLKKSLDSVKRALFDEGQTVRELFHEQDVRIQRLEDYTGLYHPSSRPSRGRRWNDKKPAPPETDDGDGGVEIDDL